MIQAVTDYIVAALSKIERPDPDGGTPLKVYPPDNQRDQGETEYPCCDLTLVIEPKEEYDRPHCLTFKPSIEQQSIQIRPELGHLFKAETFGSEQGPFEIVASESDVLKLRVGTPDAWGLEQTITFLAGSKDAWEIVRAINYWARGVVATEYHGRVHIEVTEAGNDLEILAGSTAAETLGMAIGVISHLTRIGPVSYTIKPQPIPIILTYQVDLKCTEKAQRDALLPMVLNLFPEEHWPTINGQSPHFRRSDSKNFDELSEPQWVSSFWMEVDCVWLERKQAYQVKSILTPALEFAG